MNRPPVDNSLFLFILERITQEYVNNHRAALAELDAAAETAQQERPAVAG